MWFVYTIVGIALLYRIYRWVAEGKICKHCGAVTYEKNRYYSRGHNTWCRQAAGSEGYWCEACCKVSFTTTDEEYAALCKRNCDWVIPYHQKARLRAWLKDNH